MDSSRLAALSVTRRLIGIAVFDGISLGYTTRWQLASSISQAQSTATATVNWLIHQFDISAVAILHEARNTRAATLAGVAESAARIAGLAITRIPVDQLFEAYAYPPLRAKKQLRETVTGIWPALPNIPSNGIVRDAAALGLFTQTQRLLNAA